MKHYLRGLGVLVVGSLIWAATCRTVEVGVDNFMMKDEYDFKFKDDEKMDGPVKARKKWEKLPDNLDQNKGQ